MKDNKRQRQLAVIRIEEILPLDSGGAMASYYYISLLSNFFQDTTLYFFEKKTKKKGLTLKRPYKKKHLSTSFLNYIFLWRPLRKLHLETLLFTKELKKIKADVIYLDFPYLYGVAKVVSKNNFNAPIILVSHNVEWKYYKQNGSFLWPIIKFFEEYVWKKVDLIITLSNKEKEYISRAVSNPNKVLYIPPNVPKHIFSPRGKKIKFPKDKLNVLFYGSLSVPQNKWAINYILENIYPHFRENSQVIFHIFGSGKLDRNLPNADNLRFYGTVEDPSHYIRAADIIIVPIKNSGGVKIRILESLSCGKVVITTPEGAEGLHNALKKLVIICKTPQQFIQKISYFASHKYILSDRYRHIIKSIKNFDTKIRRSLSKELNNLLIR